jgi:predicted unusual protein kinase regulating ubiquinone biosynthesis (AarF/ABC1/UbiB family)
MEVLCMSQKTQKIHGFTQAVRFLRVSRLLFWTIWVIYRERRRVLRAHQKGHYEVKPNVDVLINVLVAFRHTALELGVLMIKLGQFLSTRVDLLPEQALAVLASLQDEVPAEPFSHVEAVISEELGKPVELLFSHFECEATAAASLGQVHRAVLASSDEEVAVKVQRPHIEHLVRMDLRSLKFVVRVISRFVDTGTVIDLKGVYREFERTVYEEMDFISEAANCKRFQELFRDDPTIYIPAVYEAYTTRRVLVLEWINGLKINDYAALEAAGIDRLEVAHRTVQAYFHQFFDAGFFHADPHPGNIFVQRGTPENGPIIAFVDFGMVGSFSSSMREALKKLLLSFLTRDAATMVQVLTQLGFIGTGAHSAALEHGLGRMLEQYYGMTLGEARELDILVVADEIGKLLYDQPFHIPAQFTFIGRAVSALVGLATGLAPEFNFIDVAAPYARKFMGLNTEDIGMTLQQLLRQVLLTINTFLKMPGSLQGILTKLENGQFVINLGGDIGLGATALRRHRSEGANSAFPLALACMFVASVGCAFLFDSVHDHILAIAALLLAAILGVRLLFRW